MISKDLNFDKSLRLLGGGKNSQSLKMIYTKNLMELLKKLKNGRKFWHIKTTNNANLYIVLTVLFKGYNILT